MTIIRQREIQNNGIFTFYLHNPIFIKIPIVISEQECYNIFGDNSQLESHIIRCFKVISMKESLNFTVTKIGHIHFRMSNPQWGFVDLVNPNNYILAYAESGKVHYLLDGKDITVLPNQLCFFQVGEPHTAWADPEDPWRYFSLSFDLLFLDDESRELIQSVKTLHIPRNHVRCRNLLFAIYWAWNTQKPGYYLEIRSLLMDLLREIFCGSYQNELTDTQQFRMQKVLSHIHENLTETYSVATLAQIAGFSESHFSKLFRQMTGQSVINYQNMLRLTQAKNLIQLGDCNVSEAAAAVGFRDIYYFSRLYKKMMGAPPSGTMKK